MNKKKQQKPIQINLISSDEDEQVVILKDNNSNISLLKDNSNNSSLIKQEQKANNKQFNQQQNKYNLDDKITVTQFKIKEFIHTTGTIEQNTKKEKEEPQVTIDKSSINKQQKYNCQQQQRNVEPIFQPQSVPQKQNIEQSINAEDNQVQKQTTQIKTDKHNIIQQYAHQNQEPIIQQLPNIQQQINNINQDLIVPEQQESYSKQVQPQQQSYVVQYDLQQSSNIYQYDVEVNVYDYPINQQTNDHSINRQANDHSINQQTNDHSIISRQTNDHSIHQQTKRNIQNNIKYSPVKSNQPVIKTYPLKMTPPHKTITKMIEKYGFSKPNNLNEYLKPLTYQEKKKKYIKEKVMQLLAAKKKQYINQQKY